MSAKQNTRRLRLIRKSISISRADEQELQRLASIEEAITGRRRIRHRRPAGTKEDLTAILAEQVMRWGVAPDRFLLEGRRWLPRWRFQPVKSIEDAFRLLEELNPHEYTMNGGATGDFRVRVRLHNGCFGEATDKSKARAITTAVARAIGVDFT